MNRGDVVGVNCPCCKAELYRQTLLESNRWAIVKGSPSLETDDDGMHMKCPHCACRIAFTALPRVEGAPLDFLMADLQTCKAAK